MDEKIFFDKKQKINPDLKDKEKIAYSFKNFLNKIFKKIFFDNKFYYPKKDNKKKYESGDKFFIFLEKLVYDYYQPTLKFVLENKQKIKNNYYDVIIGNDIKGRLPTLILKEIFNYYRAKSNLSNVEIKFVNGGQLYLWDSKKFNNVLNYLRKLDLKDKKILLVTEFVLFDDGFLELANVLKHLDLNFDCFIAFSRFNKKMCLYKGREIF